MDYCVPKKSSGPLACSLMVTLLVVPKSETTSSRQFTGGGKGSGFGTATTFEIDALHAELRTCKRT